MAVFLSPVGGAGAQFFDNNGNPLSGGKLFTYAAGTTTPATAYTSSAGNVAHTNPIVMDAAGRVPGGEIWLTANAAYKFVLRTSTDVLLGTYDNIDGINSIDVNAQFVVYDPPFTGSVPSNAEAKFAARISVRDFGAVGDGVTNDTAAIQTAVNYVASLTGPQYEDSFGSGGNYGYGVSRELYLDGVKYLVTSPIVLTGDVSLYADGGGFLAGVGFTAGAAVLDTGVNPYGGRIHDLTIDGDARNVRGINVRNAHACRLNNISIINCANDGIVYTGGAELILDNFEVSGAETPAKADAAGLIVFASDGTFSNGVLKYNPLGLVLNGGGNHQITNVHAWGLYASYKQYVNFYLINSVRNTFTACYADSPTKQDYTQSNAFTINGIPNGGIGFYADATSTQNLFVGCRGYINTVAYAAAGLPGTNQFLGFYIAAQFNQIHGYVYNYDGNWIQDIAYSSTAISNDTLVLGRPNLANGIAVPVLAQVSDAGGGVTTFAVTNSNSGFATSSAESVLNVGSTAISKITAVYGPAGASYRDTSISGDLKERIYAANLTEFLQNNPSEGSIAFAFKCGVGSFNPLAVYRADSTATPNANFAAAKVGASLSNGRSLNAAGTINASGTDYAEYMTKCGNFQIAKGDICGINADGQLTNVFNDAVSFVVKSTNPSYVGGDGWGTEAALGCKEPIEVLELKDGETEDQFAQRQAQYAIDRKAFDELIESRRQLVDRIAFSGQVPVNVLGAAPGDYIVPVEDNGIKGVAVAAPTFEQYQKAVGKVISIESDGRAKIIVKVA